MVPDGDVIQLYIDDSGSRYPDKGAGAPRLDNMDHFALGGLLVHKPDVKPFLDAYHAFCRRWGIDYPLHSTKIRSRKKQFAWLGRDSERESRFLGELSALISGLPFVALACVVHRPGYLARYYERYGGQPWMMCKTAFAILVERAAKYADERGRKLELFFEGSGRAEDRGLVSYMRLLKSEGMPFNGPDAGKYAALRADDFRRIVLGEPHRRTKETPMCQVADLVLYPMAKARYDCSYRPYRELMAAGKLIDALLPPEEVQHLGIKYSCFDGLPAFEKIGGPA